MSKYTNLNLETIRYDIFPWCESRNKNENELYEQESNNNRIQITSINFTFHPTDINMPKSLWLQLRFPPPMNLGPGSLIKIVPLDHNLILPPTPFYVQNVIGTRVLVEPYRKEWVPSDHGGNYGYSLKDWEFVPSHPVKDFMYGYGLPMAYLYVIK